MARMRSLKPEFWDDEELATSTSRDARMLYQGMWNFADEHSRLRGDPRYLKGKIFAYEDDLTAGDIAKLTEELVQAGRVVRYRVGNGHYLFLPKLHKHQRLEPDKVPSRLPAPEDADIDRDPPPGNFPDPSERHPDEAEPGADESAQNRTVDDRLWDDPPGTVSEQPQRSRANKSAQDSDESALVRARLFKHVAGSREHVAGTASPGAFAPRADTTTDDPPTAQTLIAEWIDNCRKPPPGNVVAQVGKHLKAMLAEGIDPTDLRRGLAHWANRGMHPATLPSVVNEVMNASATVVALSRAAPARPSTSDQRAAEAIAAGNRVQAMLERRTAS